MVSLNFKKEKHDSLNTRQGDVNLYVILLVVLILAHSSFAQEEAAQTSVPAYQSGTSDVVEMESDLGVGDMKMGGTTKDNKLELKSVSPAVNSKSTLKGIKPSANYKTKEQGPEATDQKQIKDVSKANLSEQQLQDQRQKKMDERMKAAEADLDDAIESDVVKKTPTVEEFIPSKPDAVLTDKQVVMISESLRKLIDENDQLKKQLSDVDQQLKNLRGEQKLGGNRLQEITIERDALRQQTVTIANHNSENEKLVKELQEQLNAKQKEYETKIFNLQNDLANLAQNPGAAIPSNDLVANKNSSVSESNASPLAFKSEPQSAAVGKRSISVNVASSASVEDAKKEGKMILDGVNALRAQRSQLLKDEAKVHYNMGNTYYNQGDYLSAAEEYEKAIALTPEDPNAHYNLAFVSGEILHHPKSAIIHYKKYLFLNPNAEDAEKVRQKIIESEILVKGKIRFDSRMDQELRDKQNEVNEISSY